MKTTNTPIHIGLIMDGNGRWAQRRGLPRKFGYRHGAEACRKIISHARDRGIKYVTAFAFSTENWKRPPDEIDVIMELLRDYLGEFDCYRKENVRVCFLGDPSPLAPDLQEIISGITRDTGGNDGLWLNFAINYGGRDELLHAAKGLIHKYSRGEIGDINALTEEDFESCLFTAGQPDVDLVIRTSGELRISNFLLWQSAYAEYAFPEMLWPDFTPSQFDKVLADYSMRSRRKGGL